MKKLLLIITTFAVFNAMATETQMQPNIFKRVYNVIPKKIKSGTGLVISGIGATFATAGTTYLGIYALKFFQEGFHCAKAFSLNDRNLINEGPSQFSAGMFYTLNTLTVGAVAAWCLYYFGKNYKELFIPKTETETPQS